jgi:uncharacterized protein YegL
MEYFKPRIKEDNPDPRIACALLLDTSSSMSGAPIDQLNQGFELFCDEIKSDDLAKKRAEIAVITFGGSARVEIPFTEGRDLVARRLVPGGATPMGAALDLALDQLSSRKQEYRQAGLEYFRPWMFVLTDGAPTDGTVFTSAASRVRAAEAAKGVSVFCIGIGAAANLTTLKALSAKRDPVMLDGLSFLEFFKWLSASLSQASASTAHGASEAGVAAAETTEQIPLPSPTGWAVA